MDVQDNMTFPIDGYFINSDFDIWKVTSISENTAIMEVYSHRRSAIRTWAPIEMTISAHNDGYLLRGFYLGRFYEFYAFIFKKDDNVYLETGTVTRGEDIYVSKADLYKKVDFTFDQKVQHRISDFIDLAMGLRYTSINPNEIWIINPLYPMIFASRVIVNDNFRVISIEEGNVIFKNDMFRMQLPSYEFYFSDAIELFGGMPAGDIYSLSMASRYDRQKFMHLNIVNIGDYLYEALYRVESFEVSENSINANYAFINQVNAGMLVSFPNFGNFHGHRKWLLNSDRELLRSIPNFGQSEVIYFEVINDTEVHVKLEVDDFHDNSHYSVTFIFRR